MTARHQHVAEDLRRLIAAGTYAEGARLPSEARLAAHYRVSTPTLREALELLRAEGLVEKFHGRGNFVRRPTQRITYPSGAGDGLHVAVSSGELTATGELAARLGVQPESPVTEFVCLTRRADSPQSLAHVYLPHAAAQDAKPPADCSPWGDDIVLAADPAATASTDRITARFPTTDEAQSLRVGGRTPVLAIERTFTADDGRVVASARLVLLGDRADVAVITPITPIAHTDRPEQQGNTLGEETRTG